MPKADINFDIDIDVDAFNAICRVVLANIPNYKFSETPSAFWVEEYKVGLLKGTYPVSAFIKYSGGMVSINAHCSGIGPFQKKHVLEAVEIIKGIIERGIKENISSLDSDDEIRCPKCGSRQIQLQKRGWTWTTGAIGKNKNERVCMQCLYKF